MLITSRTRERLFPKVIKIKSRKKTCKREAFEEAGIIGKVFKKFPITQRISKSQNGKLGYVCIIIPCLYLNNLMNGPKKVYGRHWIELHNAMSRNLEPEFVNIIKNFIL